MKKRAGGERKLRNACDSPFRKRLADAPRTAPSTQRDKNPSAAHESDKHRDATQRGMPDQGRGTPGQAQAEQGGSAQRESTGASNPSANDKQQRPGERGESARSGSAGMQAKSDADDESCADERKDEAHRVSDASRRSTSNKGQEKMNEDAAG